MYPFILRGISLVGIDSASCPLERRKEIWKELAGSWRLTMLDSLTTRISLDQLNLYIEDMLAGRTKGRIVVDLEGPVQ